MQQNKIGKIYKRPWGTYETLQLGDNYQVKIITIDPKGSLSLQKHFSRCEHWIVIKGKPTITVGSKKKTYKINDVVYIPIETPHRIENQTDQPAAVIEVQIGSYLGEDDIERLEDIYGRI
ncbi:MAG: mannose-6-phosphate isomerase [Coxiella sp. DG_40]|nr:MAG: mannose-6-phosphate isomerase [Coxiella sp. DG_40]